MLLGHLDLAETNQTDQSERLLKYLTRIRCFTKESGQAANQNWTWKSPDGTAITFPVSCIVD